MYDQEKIKPYRNEGNKVEQVEQMFDHIAPAYDRLNHLMSFGIDRSWRKQAINALLPFQPKKMMDVATGTGDFAILAARVLHPTYLLGTDISEGMLEIGRQKVKEQGLEHIIDFACEDCCNLSFDDNTFDAIITAFGVRNFANLDKGLQEMHRVLTENGHLVILELSSPKNKLMHLLFKIYSSIVIPCLGRLISKDIKAYYYLPKTIQAFSQGEVMKGILEKDGFHGISFKRLTFGICTLYIAKK